VFMQIACVRADECVIELNGFRASGREHTKGLRPSGSGHARG
jgi:hypothetical protein